MSCKGSSKKGGKGKPGKTGKTEVYTSRKRIVGSLTHLRKEQVKVQKS